MSYSDNNLNEKILKKNEEKWEKNYDKLKQIINDKNNKIDSYKIQNKKLQKEIKVSKNPLKKVKIKYL